MIGQILRLSTIFANMMAAAGLALAITIAVAGTVERSSAHCYACLSASGAIQIRSAAKATVATPIQIAFGSHGHGGAL
jgi:hypothetical protein